MTELDCRILARACGLEWVDYSIPTNDYEYRNPGFDSPDDWEMVRVNVILPNILLFESIIYDNGIQWWLQKTSHELCKTAVDIIKAHPNRFPWVVEVMEEKK